jgi:hypothetical protein
MPDVKHPYRSFSVLQIDRVACGLTSGTLEQMLRECVEVSEAAQVVVP